MALFSPPKKKKNLWDQITEGAGNAVRSLGRTADRVIPGNQASWGGQAPPVVQPTIEQNAPNLRVAPVQPAPAIKFTDNGLSTQSLESNQLRVEPEPQRRLSVATPQVQAPQVERENFVGYKVDAGKPKTIMGRDVSRLIPGTAYDKTYKLKAEGATPIGKDQFLQQFDKMDKQFQRTYVQQVMEQARSGNGNFAAQHTIETLKNNGRFKGDLEDFMEGSNEALYGGLTRGAARTGALVVSNPIVNNPVTRSIPIVKDVVQARQNVRTGLEEWADKDAARANQFTTAGRAGETAGHVQKGIVDVGTMVVGGGEAEKAVKGIRTVQNLSKGGRLARTGAYAAENLAGSGAGSAIEIMQTKGRGDEMNIPKSVGIAAAIDLAAPAALKYTIKGGKQIINSLAGNVDIPPLVTQLDQGLVDEGRIGNQISEKPIGDLTLGSGTISDPLDEVRVQEFMDDIQQGKPVQPVITSGGTVVEDGAHRLEAMRRLGIKNVPTVELVQKVDPATVIAKKYGGDPAQIQLDIDRLGVNGADDLYASYYERSNARNTTGNNLELDIDPRARFGNRTPETQIPLHEKYGVKQETADRLVRDYGAERAEGALRYMDEAAGSGTIRSRDGFAVGQAQKMFGKVPPPTGKAGVVKMSDAELTSLDASAPPNSVVDDVMDLKAEGASNAEVTEAIANTQSVAPTTTTPTLRPPNINAVTGEVQDLPTQIQSLPDHNTASVDDLPTVKSFSENFDTAITQAREQLDEAALRRMQDEIVEYHRSGTPVSDESVKLYKQIFEKPYEAMGLTRRSAGGTVQDFYLHETKGANSGEKIDTGYGFVDTVNQEFGANMHRTGSIASDEMTDPLTALQEYKDQYLYDKYRVLREAEHYAKQGYADPVGYVKQKNDAAQRLAAKVDKNVENAIKNGDNPEVLTEGGESIRADLRDGYTNTGNGESYQIVNAPRTGYQGQTTRNIYKDLQMQDGSNVYETWGIKRFEDAEAQGNNAYQEILAEGTPDRETLRKQLTDRFAGVSGNTIDPVVEAQLIEAAAQKIERESLENMREFGDPTPSSVEFEKLERNLAAEQIRHFAERTDIPNKNARKVIDRFVEYSLSDSRRRISIAEKLANKVTTMFHLGALGLNPYSAAQNLTETSRIVGLFGPKTTGEAMADITSGKVKGETIRHAYGVREDIIENTILKGDGVADKVSVTGVGKKIESGMMKPFNATEGYKDAVFLRAAEIEAEKLGLQGREKVAFVKTKFEDAFKLGELGSIWGTKNPIGRLLLQFGQYPIKDWGLTLSKVRDLSIPGKQADAAKYLTGVFGAKAAYLAPMYAIFGAGMQQMFSLSAFRGGPAFTIPMQVADAVRDEQNRVDAAKEAGEPNSEFNWGNVWKSAGQKSAPIAIPGGNYLINKVGVHQLIPGQENLKIGDTPVFRQDTAVGVAQKGYNENAKGRARFNAPDDPLNWARTFLGGVYNSDNARDQFGTTPWSMQIPGSKARVGSKEGLYPVDRVTQQRIDATNDKGEKQRLIENNHKVQRGYQEIMKGLSESEQKVFDQLNGRSDVKLNDGAKNEVFWTNPKMLESMNKYAALQRELGIPSDPLYNLDPERQRIMLHYLDEETGSKDKRATRKLNPWIDDTEDARDSFFETVKNPESVRTQDERVPEYPTATPEMQTVMDQYFAMTDANQKGEFFAAHPEISDQLTKQSEWINDKRKARGAPEFDEYPQPTPEIKSLMDQYNSLPKGNGPLKKDGTASSPDRSAWIKSHPTEFAALTEQWNKQNLWTLQNGLSESVYKGIDPDESDIKDIAALGKSLNTSGSGGGGGGFDRSSGSFGERRSSGIGSSKITVKVPKVSLKKKTPAKKVRVKRGGRI